MLGFEPTIGTYVLVFIWFIGTPSQKTVVDTEKIYSQAQCDARAEDEIKKYKRRDLGIVCQFTPGIPI